MGKHLEQALPSVYTLQCLTGKVDNNNNNILGRFYREATLLIQAALKLYEIAQVMVRVFIVQSASISDSRNVRLILRPPTHFTCHVS